VRSLEEETAMFVPTVHIIDANAAARGRLTTLLEEAGKCTRAFASATDFLSHELAAASGCLLLDAAHLESDEEGATLVATAYSRNLPVVVMGHADIRAAVVAMKTGAIEFLAKPLNMWALFSAIDDAHALSSVLVLRHEGLRALRANYDALSLRERQVMALVTRGLMNKQVAWELGISEITVKAHRGQVMRKMKARTFVDLVHMADQLGAAAHDSHRHAAAAWEYSMALPRSA
jgi:FixJ family two-component response regulator